MKPSRCIAFTAGYYLLVVGIIMTFLSTFALVAYNCSFQDAFSQSPTGYFFHLLYFRSHHCDSFIDWTLVGIANVTGLVEPQMPHETESVTRTFYIAVVQVIFSALLVCTSLNMLASTKYHYLCKNRRWSFWLFFSPLSWVLLTTIFIDMVTGWYYSMDSYRASSVDGTMTLLEITNRVEARPFIEQIYTGYRNTPPYVMLYVSLKGVLGLIINIIALFFVTLTAWEVVDGNKRRAVMKFVEEKKSPPELTEV